MVRTEGTTVCVLTTNPICVKESERPSFCWHAWDGSLVEQTQGKKRVANQSFPHSSIMTSATCFPENRHDMPGVTQSECEVKL